MHASQSYIGVIDDRTLPERADHVVAWIADKPFITKEEFELNLQKKLTSTLSLYNNFFKKPVPEYAVIENIQEVINELIMKKLPPYYFKDHTYLHAEDFMWLIGIRSKAIPAQLNEQEKELLATIAMAMDYLSKQLMNNEELVTFAKNNHNNIEAKYNEFAQKLTSKNLVMPPIQKTELLLALYLMAKNDKKKAEEFDEMVERFIPAALGQMYDVKIDLDCINQITNSVIKNLSENND